MIPTGTADGLDGQQKNQLLRTFWTAEPSADNKTKSIKNVLLDMVYANDRFYDIVAR